MGKAQIGAQHEAASLMMLHGEGHPPFCGKTLCRQSQHGGEIAQIDEHIRRDDEIIGRQIRTRIHHGRLQKGNDIRLGQRPVPPGRLRLRQHGARQVHPIDPAGPCAEGNRHQAGAAAQIQHLGKLLGKLLGKRLRTGQDLAGGIQRRQHDFGATIVQGPGQMIIEPCGIIIKQLRHISRRHAGRSGATRKLRLPQACPERVLRSQRKTGGEGFDRRLRLPERRERLPQCEPAGGPAGREVQRLTQQIRRAGMVAFCRRRLGPEIPPVGRQISRGAQTAHALVSSTSGPGASPDSTAAARRLSSLWAVFRAGNSIAASAPADRLASAPAANPSAPVR